jgi:CRP-like cAMP-binding protein
MLNQARSEVWMDPSNETHRPRRGGAPAPERTLHRRALERHPLFAAAEPRALEMLAASAQARRLTRDEILVEDGERAACCFVLTEGALRVFHASPEGDEVILMLLRATALYGEAEALSGGRFVESVAALEPSTVLELPAAALERFLSDSPRTMLRLLADAAQRRAIVAYQEKSLAFMPVTIRLANFLIDALESTPANGAPVLDLTQDAMAAAISATRRSVAKDVIDWQEAGVLRREGARYRVADVAALRRYADPNRLSRAYPVAA